MKHEYLNPRELYPLSNTVDLGGTRAGHVFGEVFFIPIVAASSTTCELVFLVCLPARRR